VRVVSGAGFASCKVSGMKTPREGTENCSSTRMGGFAAGTGWPGVGLLDRPQLFVSRGQFLAKYKELKEIAPSCPEIASGGWQTLALAVHGSSLHWTGRESVTGFTGRS